jgi:NADH-quinone oxidoreductase subunit F
LTERDLDISMDFESLSARGSALGTASIIVMDETADMVKVAARLMEFYQNESCGKCTPCREGTRWVVQMLLRIEAGGGTMHDLKKIEQVCNQMATDSFCPLAVGAAPPVLSAMAEFKSEFEAYIRKNPNGDGLPKMLVSYPYT